MGHVRQIVSAALKLRQGMGLSLRWPARRVTVACSTEAVADAVRTFSDVIRSQVNCKELDVVPAGQEWAGQELIVVPKTKAIGKAYQLWEKKIARMLQVLPAKDVKAKIETGEYILGIEGEEIKILPDMVEFKTKLPEGIISCDFPGGSIYFDSNIDDALLAEGYARELARRVQHMRKEMGLDPEEFVRLRLKMSDELLDFLDDWLERIADGTRATQMEIVDGVDEDEYIVEWPIQEETVVIGATSLRIKESMDQFTACPDIDRELAMAIVNSGITSGAQFIETDRETLLKIPGMSHSKWRKMREFLEAPEESSPSRLGQVCKACDGVIEAGTAYCPRCGKDAVGDEDLVVERLLPESDETEDFAEHMQRDKVKIERRKKKRGQDGAEPEDAIVQMATGRPGLRTR
jgi:isoleucyl-tRNA synthetase